MQGQESESRSVEEPGSHTGIVVYRKEGFWWSKPRVMTPFPLFARDPLNPSIPHVGLRPPSSSANAVRDIPDVLVFY